MTDHRSSVTYREPIYGVVSASLTLSISLPGPDAIPVRGQRATYATSGNCTLQLVTRCSRWQSACARIEPMDWLTSRDHSLDVIMGSLITHGPHHGSLKLRSLDFRRQPRASMTRNPLTPYIHIYIHR